MKRILSLIAIGLAAALIPAFGALRMVGSSDDETVFEFEMMVGVSGPFVGTANPIRGVNGGGFPWQIAEGEAELDASGRLRVEVEGLVLFDGPPVPPALRGTNPVPSFRAILSCLTVSAGAASTTNVMTATFPATATGDAEIDQVITVPSPCFAPIVFVTSPGGAWFAVGGF